MHHRDKVQRSLISISKRKARGREGVGVKWGWDWLRVRRPIGNFALDPLSKHARNIIDVCAPRVCHVIGRRKLTCERPGNIARIKKSDEMGKKQRADRWRGTRIKIAEGAYVFFLLPRLILGAILAVPRLCISLVSVSVREITSIILDVST